MTVILERSYSVLCMSDCLRVRWWPVGDSGSCPNVSPADSISRPRWLSFNRHRRRRYISSTSTSSSSAPTTTSPSTSTPPSTPPSCHSSLWSGSYYIWVFWRRWGWHTLFGCHSLYTSVLSDCRRGFANITWVVCGCLWCFFLWIDTLTLLQVSIYTLQQDLRKRSNLYRCVFFCLIKFPMAESGCYWMFSGKYFPQNELVSS